MKVIIAGSRWIIDHDTVARAIEASGFEVSRVISGGARGVDSVAIAWAAVRNIPCTVLAPDWHYSGRGAAILRNIEMAKLADALIAVWDGESTGTGHMIGVAKARRLPTYIHRVQPQQPAAQLSLL